MKAPKRRPIKLTDAELAEVNLCVHNHTTPNSNRRRDNAQGRAAEKISSEIRYRERKRREEKGAA